MGKKLIIKGADFSANAIETGVITDITSRFSWTQYKYISVADGSEGQETSSASESAYASGYVDISSFDRINITLPELVGTNVVQGACFYDASRNVILPAMGGQPSQPQKQMTPYTFTVPSNAKYIRATRRDDCGVFQCLGIAD